MEADCFADGHDVLACVLRYRAESEENWTEAPMMERSATTSGAARSPSTASATWQYGVMAWVDPLLTWRHEFARRVDAADIRARRAQSGAELVAAAAQRATDEAARTRLQSWAKALREGPPARLRATGLDDALMRARATPLRANAPVACARRSTCASSSIPSARASARGTSCSRARPPTSRAATARSTT